MIKLLRILTILIVVTVLGGLGFFTFWDIPAPSKTVVKIIPDTQFPR